METPPAVLKKRGVGSAGARVACVTLSCYNDPDCKRTRRGDLIKFHRIPLASLQGVLPVESDELGDATARRVLVGRCCTITELSTEHETLSGDVLLWTLTSMRYVEEQTTGEAVGFIELAPRFRRFIADRILVPLKENSAIETSISLGCMWDLFLWLSSSSVFRSQFASFDQADFIVKTMFSSLSGAHKNVSFVAIVVSCLVLMLECHRSAQNVLSETNILQFLKLFSSRALHAGAALGEGRVSVPVDTFACRTALVHMLKSPHARPRHSAAIEAELSSFSKKWWERLVTFSTITASSCLNMSCNTARMVLILFDDISVVDDHFRIELHQLIFSTDKGHETLCNFIDSEDKDISYASLGLLSTLSGAFAMLGPESTEVVSTIVNASAAILKRAADRMQLYNHVPEVSFRHPLQELKYTDAKLNCPEDRSVKGDVVSGQLIVQSERDAAMNFLLMERSLQVIKNVISCDFGDVSSAACVTLLKNENNEQSKPMLWRHVTDAISIAQRDIQLCSTRSSAAENVFEYGILVAKKLLDFNPQVGEYDDADIRAVLSNSFKKWTLTVQPCDWNKELSSWVQRIIRGDDASGVSLDKGCNHSGLDDSTLVMSLKQSDDELSPIVADSTGLEHGTCFDASGHQCLDLAFHSGFACSPIVSTPADRVLMEQEAEQVKSQKITCSEHQVSSVISSSALEDWIDHDTQSQSYISTADGAPPFELGDEDSLACKCSSSVPIMEDGCLSKDNNDESELSTLKRENFRLTNDLLNQNALVQSLLEKVSSMSGSISTSAGSAAEMRREIASLTLSRDNEIQKCSRQTAIIEDSWSKMSALAKRLENCEAELAQRRNESRAAIEHSAIVEEKLILSEAAVAETRSLADSSLKRVSECISENRRLLGIKTVLEDDRKIAEARYAEAVLKIGALKNYLIEKNKLCNVQNTTISESVEQIKKLSNEKEVMVSEITGLMTELGTVKNILAEKSALVIDLQESLAVETRLFEESKEKVSVLEPQITRMSQELDANYRELQEMRCLTDHQRLEISRIATTLEEKERELNTARSELIKQKEVIMYINKLSAENALLK